MSKYYCLIAGLPHIALEDTKLTYSVAAFRQELAPVLTAKDKQLVDLFFLKFDNNNLLAYLKGGEGKWDARGSFTADDYAAAIALFQKVEEEEGHFVVGIYTDTLGLLKKRAKEVAKKTHLPQYIADFLAEYVAGQAEEEKNNRVSWEDRLSAFYYAYAMKNKNKFVADWFELNLNINNMLTAITCQKHKLDKNEYIVGDNKVADALRRYGIRDMEPADEIDYLPTLQQIADEPDLMAREKKVDWLKWHWLEENTFFKVFDIESVFAYLLKIDMLERWVTLDKAAGEKTFREIVGEMKKGSELALNEFKRNNEK